MMISTCHLIKSKKIMNAVIELIMNKQLFYKGVNREGGCRMCAVDEVPDGAGRPGAVRSDAAPASAGEALRLADASLDYLNSMAISDLDGPGCGEALIVLSQLQAKVASARGRLLRRFDAVNGHDADGHGTSPPWLMAKAGLTRKAPRAQVLQMRRLGDRPALEAALADAALTESQADE